jgi:hypothetical protein
MLIIRVRQRAASADADDSLKDRICGGRQEVAASEWDPIASTYQEYEPLVQFPPHTVPAGRPSLLGDFRPSTAAKCPTFISRTLFEGQRQFHEKKKPPGLRAALQAFDGAKK